MLGLSSRVARLVASAKRPQLAILTKTQTSSAAPHLPHLTLTSSRLRTLPASVSRHVTVRMCSSNVGPNSGLRTLPNLVRHLKESARASLSKIFAPPGSSTTHKALAALNRFAPTAAFNPVSMWNLQTAFRPYVTMGISMIATLTYLSTMLGTPDSTMRLVAVPYRYWAGDELRLLSSPFVHLHLTHLLSVSGFFLAFSTAVEVAAGPVTLLAVLLSCAVVGGAAAICAPERSANLFVERVQMGLWPAVAGLAAFFWYGVRRTPPSYVRNNPNMTPAIKLAARQLTSTLSARRIPLVIMAALALAPVPGIDSSAFGTLSGGLTGALLGFMYTRSPHLVIFNGLLAALGTAYLAQRPTWSLKYQAYKFARSWEDGDFIRAREWLNMFATASQKLHKDKNVAQWTLVSLALAEMACGRTSMALNYADHVDMSRLVLRSDLEAMKLNLGKQWKKAREESQGEHSSNIRFGGFSDLAALGRLDGIAQYRDAFQAAPWRIMNDQDIGALFHATFKSNPPLTPPQMQDLILQHYKGLFTFDPTYSRSATADLDPKLPSTIKDNPLQ